MEKKKISVIVYHSYYGCETGCCGHRIEIPETGDEQFEFWHCDEKDEEKKREWALEWAQEYVLEKFGEDHVADLDWENCRIDEGCW